MSMHMTGMKELMKHLKTLGEKGERITNEALEVGSKILRDEIEKEVRTKGLISKYNKKHLVDYIIISKIVDGVIDVGPAKDFFYAMFLEFGTKKQPATPFIEPAFLRVKDKVEREMKKVIRRELGLS